MIATEALESIQLRRVLRDVEDQGFAIIPKAVDERSIDSLLRDLPQATSDDSVRRRGGQPFGIRNFLSVVPSARKLAASEAVVTLSHVMSGDNPILVRSLFFDKFAEANWKVVWVVHFEFAGSRLPRGLEWNESN